MQRFTDEARKDLLAIFRGAGVASAERCVDHIEAQCVAELRGLALAPWRGRTRSQLRDEARRAARRRGASALLQVIAGASLPRGVEPDWALHRFVLVLRYHLVRAGLRNAAAERSHLVQAVDVILSQALADPPSARELLRAMRGEPVTYPVGRGPRLAVRQDDIDKAAPKRPK